MLIRRFLILCGLILGLSVCAEAQTTHNPPDCERTTLNNWINLGIGPLTPILNGDTIQCPAGSWRYSSNLTIAKAIRLLGAGCTNVELEGKQVPDTCQSVFINDSATGIILTFNLQTNQYHRFAYFELQPGTTTSSTFGVVVINGSSNGTTRIEVDNIKNSHFNGRALYMNNVVGVIHHVYFKTYTAHLPGGADGQQTFYMTGNNWYGPTNEAPTAPDYGNNSWKQVVEWGVPAAATLTAHTYPQWLFVEDSVFYGGARACFDGVGGARLVFRRNVTYRCTPGWHGVDSSAQQQAWRAAELYLNQYFKNGPDDIAVYAGRGYQYENRDGSTLAWGNTSNFTSTTKSAGLLKTYRGTTVKFAYWGEFDGTNPLDKNAPSNPQYSGVVQSYNSGTRTITVTGSPGWSAAQWSTRPAIHVVKKLTTGGDGVTPCVPSMAVFCAVALTENTGGSDTLVHDAVSGDGAPAVVSFTGGDLIEINLVLRTFEQAGYGGGSINWTWKSCTNFVGDGTYVTGNCTSHGLGSIGSFQDVIIYANGSPADQRQSYGGPRNVEIMSANSFRYPYTPVTGTSNGGLVGLLPAGIGDQSDFPGIQWKNTNSGTYLNFEISTGVSHYPNETYFNYIGGVGDQTDASTPFTGANAGVGSGTWALRPTTCTNGRYYWATDQGGDWDLANGTANDGALYKCTSNVWNPFYTPYTYPHPLATSSVSPAINSITPNTGAQGATVSAAAIVGTNLGGTVESIAVSGCTGVTTANFSVTDAENAVVDFVVAPTASVGDCSVRITVDGVQSGAATFTVTGLTFTNISPAAGNQNQNVNVTLTGTAFDVGTCSISVSGTGITVANKVCVNATIITAQFQIAIGATLGARNVTVTNGNTTSAPLTFTVEASGDPTLTGISPSQCYRGSTCPVTLTGTSFNVGGGTITELCPGIAFLSIVVVGAATITANATVDADAPLTSCSVTVTTNNGTSNAVSFQPLQSGVGTRGPILLR